jgi:glycosyltransferase involved in cell wall biosynthesis
MAALFDVQGVQSRVFGERGVARYLVELAAALERWYPEAVERYLVNPDFPMTRALGQLPSSDRVGTIDDAGSALVYHVGSAFEPDATLDAIWPARARDMHLAVTLYDLIPQRFSGTYLTEPRTRAWYRTRLELVRRADRVLAISQATAADAVELLKLENERVVVVGAAAASRFAPPRSREEALAELHSTTPRIEPGFLLYTGGIEPRKNVERLLAAYAGLPAELREAHQLVVVCRVMPDDLARMQDILRRLGVAHQVVFTDFVTDEQLTLLYGATELFVFPSFYEGYGLPVAEAAACGAAVVASDTSSLVELVLEDEARFNPYDPRSIRATIERALTDKTFLEHLRRPSSYAIGSWRDVAERTAQVYDDLASKRKRRRPPRRRARIAYVSPLPPQRSGVADYSHKLLEPLSELCDVDAFADRCLGEQRAPNGIHLAAIAHFEIVERLRGGYDRILVCMGNSEHHVAALDFVRRRGGVVLAHDVRLSGLYAVATSTRPEFGHMPFSEIVGKMYPERVPLEIARAGGITPEDTIAQDIFMARDVIAASDRFVVHSAYAANVARFDAAPVDRTKIAVAPFGFSDPAVFSVAATPSEAPVIGTFGVVATIKQTDKLVDAFALVTQKYPHCSLVVGGPPATADEYRLLEKQVRDHRLGDRIELLGYLDEEAFRATIARTTVAAQLRSASMGESPASIGDCLAAGVPTVVTTVGAARELPDDAVVKVEPDVSAERLAAVLMELLGDRQRREALRAEGQALARERSFEQVARYLYEEVVLGEGRVARRGRVAA